MSVPGDLTGPGPAELLRDRLAKLVGPENVTIEPRALAAAGVPMVPGGRRAHPSWLVRPGTAPEVAEVVRLAAGEGVAVVPRGTGSRRGQQRPRSMIVLDMARMCHVLRVDETSLLVQAQAGLTGLKLEELLVPRGLTFGEFPPAAIRSTLGGLLAVRTAGKTSARHGFLFDAVLGLSAVLADGRTVHTRVAPRRATGPDLASVLLGAEGALGVITSVTLRVHRRAETRRLESFRVPSMESAARAAFTALRQGARPAGFRIYDAPEAEAHLGPDLVWMDEVVLVACTAGPPSLAEVDMQLIADAVTAAGGAPIGPEPADVWWRRRTGHQVTGLQPPPPTVQIAAPPGRVGAVYRALTRAAMRRGRELRCHVSRFDHDGACLFATLMEAAEPDVTPGTRRVVELAAREAGGFTVGTRDPALAPYLTALRGALDPRGVMNPGVLG